MRLRRHRRRCVHIEVVRIQPGDVVIARTSDRLTKAVAEDNDVTVFSGGFEFCVARPVDRAS
jgi:hypothetical protein